MEAWSRGGAVGTDIVEGARVVAQPVGVAADTPILRLQLVDRYPDAASILRPVVRTLGLQDDAREISDQALFGQQVQPAGGNADLDEIEGICMLGRTRIVIGVDINLVDSAFHDRGLMECPAPSPTTSELRSASPSSRVALASAVPRVGGSD
jgi:hypothetical protein